MSKFFRAEKKNKHDNAIMKVSNTHFAPLLEGKV